MKALYSQFSKKFVKTITQLYGVLHQLIIYVSMNHNSHL